MEMLKNIIIIMRYITGINTSNPDLEANKNSLLIFLIKLFTINLEINHFIFFVSNWFMICHDDRSPVRQVFMYA